MNRITELGTRAKKAATALASLRSGEKDEGLRAIAAGLTASSAEILAANGQDMTAAAQNGMSQSMQDRLRLTEERIAGIAKAVLECVNLPDPVGRVLDGGPRPNGLEITRVTVPLGVVGIIFEARPNVTADCAALCLKSGNACILRGGKEAFRSNQAIVKVMRRALEGTKVPPDAIQLVEDTSREVAADMMKANGLIDVLIPRGGPGLIASVVENATVPVIETGVGNCHAFVDKSADLEMAVRIVDNGKTTRPSVCNALETLLCHEAVADQFLPMVKKALDVSNVVLRGCERTRQILGERVVPAKEEDYFAEFGDYILAVKVVKDLEEAIAHIEQYSTRHSEVIVTRDLQNAARFTRTVDSAAVYVNASTRFTDGGEFGLGAEIGISTQKLHARGPMGLRELVSYKYIVTGDGQIR